MQQGRALLNAIGNLELTGDYAEALKMLGHNLEDVARQVGNASDSFLECVYNAVILSALAINRH